MHKLFQLETVRYYAQESDGLGGRSGRYGNYETVGGYVVSLGLRSLITVTAPGLAESLHTCILATFLKALLHLVCRTLPTTSQTQYR